MCPFVSCSQQPWLVWRSDRLSLRTVLEDRPRSAHWWETVTLPRRTTHRCYLMMLLWFAVVEKIEMNHRSGPWCDVC